MSLRNGITGYLLISAVFYMSIRKLNYIEWNSEKNVKLKIFDGRKPSTNHVGLFWAGLLANTPSFLASRCQ